MTYIEPSRPASYVTSMIQFGSYIFPAPSQFASIDQKTRTEDIDVPFLPGSNTPAGFLDKKIVKIKSTLGVGGVDSNGNYMQTRDDVKAEQNRMTAATDPSSGYQTLRVGDSDGRYILAQRTNLTSAAIEASGQRFLTLEIEFTAQDPRWLAQTTSSINGSGMATSKGTTLTYPRVAISGPATNPAIAIQPAGYGGAITVATTCTLASGDQMLIDCDPRNRANAILLNNIPRLDVLGTSGLINTVGDDSFFPYMLPGSNVVTYGGGGSCVVAWQDAFTD